MPVNRLRRGKVLLLALTVLLGSIAANSIAMAQALTVTPINLDLGAGQRATSLSVKNQGGATTSIQLRVYAWSQLDGVDQLISSSAVMVSPPLATLEPGATQVVRIVLRHPAEEQEDTYRVVLDQIPPPAQPGMVNVVLRMSIPIFAAPKPGRAAHMQFHLQREEDKTYLIALNDGSRHDTLRNIEVWTKTGVKLSSPTDGSPYILAGMTRRWQVSADPAFQSEPLVLKATAGNGSINQQVVFVGNP